MMLLAPGRIGTTSPELGITISFAEISNFKVLCEIYYKDAGYMPELSFGTHFFHDLVETGIFYASIFEDDNTIKFKPDFFEDKRNISLNLWTGGRTDGSEFIDIIKVYDVSNMGLILFSDIISSKTICGIFKK